MPEQRRQIVEWIDLIQFAGVDQADEEIAHTRSVHRLVEERILTMQDRLLQHSFGDVVVEWCAGASYIMPMFLRMSRCTTAGTLYVESTFSVAVGLPALMVITSTVSCLTGQGH